MKKTRDISTAANTKSGKALNEPTKKYSALEEKLGYEPEETEETTNKSEQVQQKAKSTASTKGEGRNPQREREKQEFSEDKLEHEPKLKDNTKGTKKGK
jgi:hypothetical protein